MKPILCIVSSCEQSVLSHTYKYTNTNMDLASHTCWHHPLGTMSTWRCTKFSTLSSYFAFKDRHTTWRLSTAVQAMEVIVHNGNYNGFNVSMCGFFTTTMNIQIKLPTRLRHTVVLEAGALFQPSNSDLTHVSSSWMETWNIFYSLSTISYVIIYNFDTCTDENSIHSWFRSPPASG